MKQRIRKIWNIIATVLVCIVVVIALMLVGVKLIGLEPYIVQSGSMEPKYPTGSIIYVKDVDVSTLKVKDVITFKLSERTIATHRIVELVEEDGVIKFRTKGDANDVEDAALVTQEQVVGTPVFAVPLLGYMVSYIQTKQGAFTAISVGAVLLLILLLPDILFGEDTDKKKKAAEQTPEEVPTAEPEPEQTEETTGEASEPIPDKNGGDL